MNASHATAPMAALTAALLASPAGAASPWDAPGAAAVHQANIGALDWLFIIIAAYVVWRVISRGLKAKDRQDPNDAAGDSADRDQEQDQEGGRDRRTRAAQAAWEYLTGEQGADTRRELPAQERHEPDPPGTFNEREFLKGAKLMYGRVKQSLAMRNLADLRQFAAPDMMRGFEQQAQDDPERRSLAVMLVEATILDVRRDGKRTEVDVAYEATISDDPKTNASRKISEVWRFSRDETVAEAKWLLESMEARQ